jgi:hypothetical protein
LDSSITKREETEKPDSILAAIGGVVVKSNALVDSKLT